MPDLRVVPEPVSPPDSSLLSTISTYIRRYLVMDEESILACSLWVLHTHLIEAAYITPYLHIFSPEKESGKSTLRDVLQHLCARPAEADYVTAAVLRRSQNQWPPPTLLLDEIDAVFSQPSESSEALRSVLNAGFRRGASVKTMIQEGNQWQVRDFNVFSPKVLVGLGTLPDTIEGRCIPIRMKQKRADEHVEVFRLRRVERETVPIRAEIQIWADEIRPALEANEPEPDMPEALSGRQQDCWSALLVIADHLGGVWPSLARAAAVNLYSWRDDESQGVRLLRDIKEVLELPRTLGLASQELAHRLNDIPDAEWSHASFASRPLDASELARLLKPFHIRPERLPRSVHEQQVRGYLASQFEDAWARYLR